MTQPTPSGSLCPVAEGDLIAGKYRVGAVIAAGGMGVVVEGRHEALEQRVAIKFLLRDAAHSREAIERFLREARAAARIESAHVVRVFDVGMHDGGIPYMVMEFLEGTDLAAEMTARGALPVSEAVDRVVQALEAVAEAHAMGIVHRDLKPSNLFLASWSDKSKQRRVKVLDFGISKVASNDVGASAALTSTKSLLGSPGYMSPEQVRSTKGVDARTDVWSLGVILYELLTGEPAFEGESLGDIFAKIREEPLPPIRTKRPEVTPALEAIISRCLERDRERRFADAGALRDALMPHASARTRNAQGGGDEPSHGGSGVVPLTSLVASAETLPLITTDTDRSSAAGDPGGAPVRQQTAATWSGGGAPGKPAAFRVLIAVGIAGITLAGVVAWMRSSSTVPPTPTTAEQDSSGVVVSPAGNSAAPSVSPGATASAAVIATATPSAEATAAATASASPIRRPPGPRGIPATPASQPGAAAATTSPVKPPPKKSNDLGI